MLGLAVATVLLVRFAFDFSATNPLLAAPFWLLVAAAVIIGAANLLSGPGAETTGPGAGSVARVLLIAAIPLAFLASSLDCTGLSISGCSAFCTAVKTVWTPALAAGCAIYHLSRRTWLLTAIVAGSFVTIVPHCVCYNAANAWWIDLIGRSPECYVWGFVVTVIAAGALGRGGKLIMSAAVCWAIVAGALGFFVGHHYFRFPW